MWGQPNPDPGGDQPEPQTSREIEDLKGQNEQQQLLIAQLKEMLRKEQSTVTQEKVEEYVNTLSKVKAKKSKLKKNEPGSTKKSSSSPMDSKKHEKVNLMKQQLEENKAKLAERGMRQKDIEDMVTVLKAQLDDSSQHLINSTPSNLSSLEKNLEYSKNSSPEELYNILLVKEKRVADLAEKVQKQNATVLDLQENLREKDSVIDARTKAITLMTESLSKKGKDTLDALDDTKDQMRKMQEHFVVLESEMKARQMILLNDLKSKNTEISDLEEKNEKLIKEINTFKIERPENTDHELLIKDLNQKLEEKKAVIEDYQKKISDLENSLELANKPGRENQDEEVEKLKKQLDESNKNMIKVKAQSKSRIKDLNKRLDGFKKMSDTNVLIVQLQNEIAKLNEKNAELEEEKGNMQLKMVESIKGSTADDLKELQEKTRENMKELEEKDKVISILESDIISLKSQINDLNDAISGFSQLKNEQVTTEIQSIQVEEQLELLQSKNKELHTEIDALKKENVEHIEKIREFAKEKSELTTKLDNYIQENMELIDKLEKLSAEKVSSAESIEIVEGLTQQEKLELAAYQKNMDANLDDPIKQQEEEAPVELNESVLQLTEETAELLKKIEMFNMERKEVMTKLECLREENNQLSLKLNEVENNRDILAETYEQVQTEKDELVKENEKLSKRINDLENQNSHGDSPQEASEDNEASLKLEQLQKDLERSIEKNVKLTATLKEFEAITHEKVNLESELAQSKEKIDDLLSALNENRIKITNYELIIEENKSELINSSNKINQLQSHLTERENEIEELNVLINDLNTIVTNLEQDNSKTDIFEDMEKQIEEMKQSLNKQAEDFNEELVFVKMAGEQEIEKKNLEISKLTKEIFFKDEMMKEKDQSVNAAIEEMKQKYLVLQKQLNANSGTLEKQLEEVSAKNKEQLEKMKKIAANLKKKNKDYQELEEKYVEEKEKWETEINKKETDLQELSSNVSILEQRNVDLQNMLLESKQRHEKTTEVSLHQELSTSLHEEFDNPHGSKESINEDKIKEMQLIMETTEGELHHYKERSQMLEEDLAVLLEEKEKLLHKISQLEEKLNLLSMNFEEKSMLEEEMSTKLQEVSAKDETLTRRFDELSKENKQLTDKTREQEELILKLKIKIKKGQEKINQMKNLQASLDEKEEANTGLKRQVAHLEALQKQTQIEFEEKQKQNQKDYEKIETDYQLQLEGLVKNRNDVTFECEKLQEEVKLLKEREEELLAELNEFNQKLSDAENHYTNEIASLTESLSQASAKWSSSVQTIEILQKQLDNLQIQAVHDAAKTTIEDVILDAKEKVDNNYSSVDASEEFFQQNFPTLEWGNEVNPPPQVSDVTKECLENKIRALEILLYNVDQEKKEVVQECSDMLNELTRLIYEKVNLTLGPSAVSDPLKENAGLSQMESQILFSDDIEQLNDPIKLQELEFERSDASLGQQNRPVVEHIVKPAKAYLTYQAGGKEEAGLSQMESQILFSDDIERLNDPNRLQELEFERSDPSLGQQNRPVVEQLVQPSKAYLTYQVGEAIGENDDGWGWGPEEARLEEEHQYRAENTPQVQALKAEVQQLEEKLQQNERENHLEEIKQLRLKSGKLVKKCKELKLKNDQLLAKIRSDSNDLDTTIQEELKTQIEQLETKMKETSSELDKEKQDKSKLLRKVDSLTSANEKMLETSQIKDSEIYRWKRKCEEIQEKLDHLDWDNDETKLSRKQPEESTESVPEDMEELKKLVQDLTVDNEELQALLNDQKQQQKQLQRSQSVANEERIKNLEEDLQSNISSFKKLLEEKDMIVEELNKKISSLQSFQEQLQNNETLDNLRKEIEDKNVVISELEGQIKRLEENYIEAQKAMESLLEETRLGKDLENQLAEKTALAEQLEYSNNSLFQEISGLRDDLANLKNQSEFQDAKEGGQPLVDCNPLIQELTNFKASSIKDLLDLLDGERINLERTQKELIDKKAQAEQLGHSNDSFYQEISGLRQELESLQDQLEIQNLQKGKLELLEDYNPLIQEATQFRAMSIKGLLDLLNEERVKVEQAQALLKAQDQEFDNWRQQYNDLQNATSKNILELQTSLESEKLKNDQLQIENVNKLKEVTEEFSKLQSDLQPSSNSGDQLSDRDLNEELNRTIDGLQVKNGELENEIKQLNESLYSKQQELLEMENKLVETISGLEDKWIAQVDERGIQVADSWKYHLSIVESDFAAVQEKLRNEINELEEKYNALVNENNELRKNVDADIKNEVNRISALQQQINDRQHALNEMGQVLVSERIEKEALAQRVAEMDKVQQLLSDKEVELASLKALAETTRQQFDEKREVVEEIVKILERNTSFPLSCEKQDILNEIQRQLSQLQEVDSLNSQLQHLVDQVKDFTGALKEKDNEIMRLKEEYDKEFSNKTDNLNSQLQHLVDQVKYFTGALQEKEDEIIRLKEQYDKEFSNKTENIAGLNESIEQLQGQAKLVGQKDEEIVRLEKIIEENKIQLSFAQQESQNLQQLYEQSNMAVDSYKQKLEEFRQTQISLQNSIEEKNRQNEYLIEQVQSLNQQLQISTDNRDKQQIENELIQTKEAYLVAQQSLSDCQQQLFNLTQDLATKSHDFETVGQQLAFSQQNVDILSEEIQKLNQLLQNKEHDYGASLENIEKTRYKELEYYYEEIMSAKEMDIQALKAQLAESVRNSGDLENKLKQLEAQITTLSADKSELDSKMSEQTSLIEEENKQLTEMRSIIEGQVVKIEELKKELFEKSNDYDSLIAEMDISRTAITQQPTASEPRVTHETENPSVKPEERQASPEDDLSEPVNRAELNLALYMLHQRDVRCEELTVELTQLLEERDALQLRLSNAIREKEEIKRNMKDPPNPMELASTSSGEATQKASGTSEMFHGSSGTSLPIELSEKLIDGQDLATKLSELRTVGYKKDKTFVDEQERRRVQQISIMQQHIREASKLPPEAAAKLVDASYTLSRDIQSPSKVLLNWLWGRSTPRVNDT